MLSTDERYYPFSEAAKIIGVERSIFYGRVKSGLIKPTTFSDGTKRISRSEILRYVGVADVRTAAE
jgi:predicted site-specific integrase-resolvase